MSSIETKEPVTASSRTNTNQNLITKNNFNMDIFQYPEDLGADDLQHFIQFNINIRGKSEQLGLSGGRLGNERNVGEVVRDSNSSNLSTEDLSKATTAAVVGTGAVAGVAAGELLKRFLFSSSQRGQKTGGSRVGSALKTVAAAGAGAAGAYILSNFLDELKPDTSFRISDVIALYVDGPPTVRYAAQYSNKDLGTIAGLAAGGVSGVASSEGVSALAMQFAKLPGALGVNIPDVVSASAKVTLNPFKEVLFEAIDFRTFNFKYRFLPKSEYEVNKVEEIIKRFKFHMHPDLSTNKLFFIYPSEFEIMYMFRNEQNTYFHKFKPCVLENMEITYGGDQFSSFSDGRPTEVNMTLTFRETEILTKKQIKEGY